MKVYLITEKDIKALLTAIDRDPAYGKDGGSCNALLTKEEREVYDEAHRFYNYQVRNWLDQIKSDK